MANLFDVQNLTAGITKNGKYFKILDNINFSIDEGEIAGLAGESGCGKSMTALSILNLLPQAIKITSGRIIYNGIDLTSLSEKEMCKIRGSEISIIFQDSSLALNPTMKAGKQIAETLELAQKYHTFDSRNKEEIKTKTLEILNALGFDDPQKIFDAYPHQLSGGMCQRVMTAIAAVRQPKILLADEPSSSLDEESQKRCLSLLLEMNRNNKMSLLVISHDLSIIQQFCSRFIIMYAGKVVEEGPAQALFSPLHPYTQALIKALPNKDKRGVSLENIPGKVPSIEDQLNGCPFAPRCSKAQNICKESFPPVKEFDNRKVHCYYPIESKKLTTEYLQRSFQHTEFHGGESIE